MMKLLMNAPVIDATIPGEVEEIRPLLYALLALLNYGIQEKGNWMLSFPGLAEMLRRRKVMRSS